jgi:hypothetical protein
MSTGLRQGIYSARSWTAPRLDSAAGRFDSAANYCTNTVAPRLSSALRSTASQVRPEEVARSKRSSLLTWSLLGFAVAAALGAAATLARYRYRAAIAADSEPVDEEVLGDSTGSQPASTTPGQAPTETPVNGRVASPGW